MALIYPLPSTIIRVCYFIFDGILPFIIIGIGLHGKTSGEWVFAGLILIFVITLFQYMFLEEEGHAPTTDAQFLFAMAIPVVVVGIEWVIVGGTFFQAVLTLSVFSLYTRTIGHLLSVAIAPALTNSLSNTQAWNYYKTVLPQMGAFLLFILYPIILGIQLLVVDQFQHVSQPWQAWLGITVLAIGFCIQSYRFAKMLGPQGFIDYLGTSAK